MITTLQGKTVIKQCYQDTLFHKICQVGHTNTTRYIDNSAAQLRHDSRKRKKDK